MPYAVDGSEDNLTRVPSIENHDIGVSEDEASSEEESKSESSEDEVDIDKSDVDTSSDEEWIVYVAGDNVLCCIHGMIYWNSFAAKIANIKPYSRDHIPQKPCTRDPIPLPAEPYTQVAHLTPH